MPCDQSYYDVLHKQKIDIDLVVNIITKYCF